MSEAIGGGGGVFSVLKFKIKVEDAKMGIVERGGGGV